MSSLPTIKLLLKLRGKVYMDLWFNRLEFGQRLLSEALDVGVELVDIFVFSNP